MAVSRNTILSLAVVMYGGISSYSSASFTIDSSGAEGRKTGQAFLQSNLGKVYPEWPDTGIDSGDTSAGTSDGVSDQNTYTYDFYNASESATASGSSTAMTPATSPASVGSLQAVAGASVAGGAIVSTTDFTLGEDGGRLQENAGAAYFAEHGASALVTGTPVNDWLPLNVVLVGKLYTAVQGGCVNTSSGPNSHTASFCDFGGQATANVEGHVSTAGFGEGQSLTDFQTFRVTIGDGNAGETAFATTDVETSGGGAVYFENPGTANAGGTTVGVAAAYAWLIPDTAPAFSEGGFERMTVDITEGDNSFDNILDGDDISRLADEVRNRALIGGTDPYSVFSGASPLFDADYDLEVTYGVNYSSGVVTDSDYLVRTLLGTEYGDVNLDGVVDTDDRTIIYAHWNGTGGWSEGDLNGDGYINSADWSVWRDFEGFGVSLSIPEPSTACLLLVGLTIGWRTKRIL